MEQALEIKGISNPSPKWIIAGCLFCYYLGNWGFGILALGAFLFSWFYSYHRQYQRASKAIAAAMLYNTKHPGRTLAFYKLILQHLGCAITAEDGIKWVGFPEWESIRFCDQALSTLWLGTLKPRAESSLKTILTDYLSTIELNYVKKMSVQECDLGQNPPRIRAVRFVPTKLNRIIFDFDLAWDGDVHISLPAESAVGVSLKIKIVGFKISKATVRVSLSELIQGPPGFSAVLISLTKEPKMKLKVKAAGISLTNQIHQTLMGFLNWYMVFPKQIGFPVIDMTDEEKNTLWLPARTCGVLIVTVIRCRNLPSMDAFSASDPYVKVKVSEIEFKTRTIQDNNNPVWDQSQSEFDFVLTEPEKDQKKLHVSVYDYDQNDSDDFIGETHLNLSKIPINEPIREWYHLKDPHKKHKRPRGEIQLQMLWKPFLQDEEAKGGPPPSRESTMEEMAVAATQPMRLRHSTISPQTRGVCIGILEVHCIRAENLMDLDITGKSDPYLRFTYGEKKQQTRVVYGTCNPYWDEHFKIRIVAEHQKLFADVYDKDRFDSDHLGSFVIDVPELFGSGKCLYQYYLVDKKGEAMPGCVHVGIEYRAI